MRSLVTTGLFALVFGFSSAETRGWASPVTWVPLVLGVLLIAAFVLVQHRSSHPLLPPGLLADRDRAGAYVALLTAAAAMFAVFLCLSYYLQEVLDYSLVVNGLAFLPLILTSTLCSTVLTRRLIARFGTRVVVPSGLTFVAAGLLWFVGLDATSSYLPDILPGLLLFGFGVGMTVTTATNLGTARTSGADAGAGAALVNTLQQIGGSLGIALLGTISAAVAATREAGGVGAAVAGYSAAYQGAAVIVGVGVVWTALLRSKRDAPDRATRDAVGSAAQPAEVPAAH